MSSKGSSVSDLASRRLPGRALYKVRFVLLLSTSSPDLLFILPLDLSRLCIDCNLKRARTFPLLVLLH